jgi:mannose-6-phosphate isomerase-like protein (cupin superfamily)
VTGQAGHGPGEGAAVAFPGATGVTLLDVYNWPCADGLRGGSAHIHLASTEAYVVTAGAGRLQTLGAHGYAEVALRPGDCLWFTPGTVHRLVNDDGNLKILVVMQNAGLPEAGDCVLTFPPEVLADPARYAAAAAGPAAATGPAETDRADAARRRRDLAIEGFLALREDVTARGPEALEPFLDAAARLVSSLAPGWRERWRKQAAAVSALTGAHLDAIEQGHAGHLRAGTLMRIGEPAGPRGFGMCGRLTTYPPALAEAVAAGGGTPGPGGASALDRAGEPADQSSLGEDEEG